jgi:hypothetical protein
MVRQDALLFEVDSINLRYERTAVRDVVPDSVFCQVLRAEWRIASLGENWLIESRATEASRRDDVHMPAGKSIQLCRGPMLLEWGGEGWALIDHFGNGRNAYQGLYYFEHAGFDVVRRIAAAGGASDQMDQIRAKYPDQAGLPYLAEFVGRNAGSYVRGPAAEMAGETETWVFDWPGMDKIWVDPKRDFAPVRRAYAWAPDKPLRVDVVGSDFREVRPGLWLPFKQVVSKYASYRDPKHLWGKVVTIHEYQVRECQFNTLEASDFEIKLTPGTMVHDSIRKIEYTVLGDETDDPFSEAIVLARQKLLAQRGTSRVWIVGGSALAVVAIFFLSWRWRKGRAEK